MNYFLVVLIKLPEMSISYWQILLSICIVEIPSSNPKSLIMHDKSNGRIHKLFRESALRNLY